MLVFRGVDPKKKPEALLTSRIFFDQSYHMLVFWTIKNGIILNVSMIQFSE